MDIIKTRRRAARWRDHDAKVPYRNARGNTRGNGSTEPGLVYRGRRLTREEFNDRMADYASECIARDEGRTAPAARTRRHARLVPPIIVSPPPTKPSRARLAANDNPRPAPVVPATVSTPDRIAKALSPELRKTLARLRELTRPADLSVIDLPLSNNDNTGAGLDFRHDITPGNDAVEDLIRAFSDGLRSRIVINPKGRIERFDGGIRYYSAQRSGEIVEVGGRSSRGKFFGLRAHRGAVTAYAKNGKRLTPAYDIGDARGSDDAEMPRETTATPAAHPVITEIDRADSFAAFCSRIDPDSARVLRVILDADNFQEVARAVDMTPTAHNGRRATEKMLEKAQKLMAA